MNKTTVSASSSLHAFVGACTIIGVWLVTSAGIKVPDEIALAFQTVLAVGIHYLVSRGNDKPAQVQAAPKPVEPVQETTA